jgi:hypothetical protein
MTGAGVIEPVIAQRSVHCGRWLLHHWGKRLRYRDGRLRPYVALGALSSVLQREPLAAQSRGLWRQFNTNIPSSAGPTWNSQARLAVEVPAAGKDSPRGATSAIQGL